MKVTCLVLIILFIAAALYFSGCTVRFKATDLDWESDAVQTFYLDGIELTRDTDQNR